MTNEEIDVLVNLQGRLNTLKNEYQTILNASKNHNKSMSILFNGYCIYPKNVSGLDDILFNTLEYSYNQRIKDLEKQLSELVLCTEVKSKGKDYLPIKIV